MESITFYGNTFRALRVEGVGNIIRGNIFQDTGGTNIYNPAIVAAVETYGPGAVIEDNIIYNVRGSGYGILVSNLGAGTTIRENLITAASPVPHSSYSTAVEGISENAWTWAIAVQGPTTNATIAANTIANFDFGIAYLASAQGLITENVVSNTVVPFYAPSGPDLVSLARNNIADRRNFLVLSADGLVTGSGWAQVPPAPRARINPLRHQNAIHAITGPTVITQPGRYRLAHDLTISSGIAIEVRADDVYIDLNGHTLYGPSQPNTTAIGIYANSRSRIRIANGSIVGFQYGVYLSDHGDLVLAGQTTITTGGHVVENVRFLGNTFRAIRIEGRGNILRNNIIHDTGGSNLYRPPFAVGIETIGPGTIIVSNHTYALRGQGAGILIRGPSDGTIVQDNVISQARRTASSNYPSSVEGLLPQAETWGIRLDGPNPSSVIRDNAVNNFVYGIGITANAGGVLAENLASGCLIPYYTLQGTILVADNNDSDTLPSVTTQPASPVGGNGNPPPIVRPSRAISTQQVYYINSPLTITRPGIYVLSGDIIYNRASGAAIHVAANNVTVDLNNYAIIGLGISSTTAYGIYARNQERITIRNGTISGFQYGIYLANDSDLALSGRGFHQGGHLVENVRLIGNTFRGIRIEGRGNVIRENIVQDTGGTSVYDNPMVVGIESLGPGTLIEDNYVYAIRGHGYGIAISGLGGGTVVRNNFLSQSSLIPTWAYRAGSDGVMANANTYGIYIGDRNGQVAVYENNIINFAVGIGWHPRSGGILARNRVTESRVAYYLPGRPNPLVSYAPTNSSDTDITPVTSETDLVSTPPGPTPPLARTMRGIARQVHVIQGPTVITRPGIYVLTQDLHISEGAGITVRASDVVIDLQGHAIIGPDTASTHAIGILVQHQSRVTIRNGTIRGCMYGVYILGNYNSVVANKTGFSQGGHVIESLRLINNKFRGIRVEGRGNIIRNNLILNTGGTRAWPNAYAFGIEVIGPGALVRGNVIYNTYGMGQLGEGVGISASSLAGGTLFLDNVIANSGLSPSSAYAPWPGTSQSTWGIWVGDTATNSVAPSGSNLSSALVAENIVANYRYGITIHAWSQGLMADNASMGAVVPFYTPRRDVARAIALENNQADKHPKIYTIERKY
ncbi:MAG: right-handed parallel beta-helix repeat-containing protein [Gemmatales bacterium]|nr:right-handed parallel beta-helix repeat-containing protein [Gemmatales bacterium]MDW7994203.1 right-handed parallel beta-helix repeat-containing protein [Gemmatales bacterium]